MLATYVLVVCATVAFSLLDLYITIKLVEELDLNVEANPLAKWIWKHWGTKAVVAFKLLATILYSVIMVFAGPTPITLAAATVVAMVYAWVASRGYTIRAVLADHSTMR